MPEEIEYLAEETNDRAMTTRPNNTLLAGTLVAVLLTIAAAPAAAACFADYKAKQEDPLRLHYGVIQLDDSVCAAGTDSQQAAAVVVAERIAPDGWLLLNIVSMFDESGLEEREESAGEFYLRY